ncbi:MAG: transporter, partial [Flavobacteriales bacterium]|nr:transporter [Flavobacteriales bacterium]
MMRLVFFFAIAMLLSTSGFSQDPTVLRFEDFINQVKGNHPLAMTANLQPEVGEAEVTKSRGAFDPKIQGDVSQKYFDEKQYYSYNDIGLSIPTWYGIKVEGGYEDHGGIFLNPESTIPSTGLWNAGLSV